MPAHLPVECKSPATPRRQGLTIIILALILALAAAGCGGRHKATPAAPGGDQSPSPSPSAMSPSPSAPAEIGPGTWRMLPPAPVSTRTSGYQGVWTGTEMLIHSLVYTDEGVSTSLDLAYNPTKNTWRRLPADPYPIAVQEGGSPAVWDGRELLTFGETHAAYNPTTNRWRQLPPGGGGESAIVWTGRQVLLWGGGCCGDATNTGEAFTPATNTWRPIPAAPLTGRFAPGVWTGHELIVVGGSGPEMAGALADAAAYNPDTRTWRLLPPMPAPRTHATATWTGTEVIVVGGQGPAGYTGPGYADAVAYNPTTNTWRQLPSMGIRRYDHAAVWTGRQLLVWGGESSYDLGTDRSIAPPHGVAYDPATNRWSAMPKAPLSARTPSVALWTGTEMVIWGRADAPESLDGAAYRPPR